MFNKFSTRIAFSTFAALMVPASAMAAGLCGQSDGLVQGQYQISGPEAEAINGTVSIQRGEPAYVDLTIATDTAITLETFSNDVDPLIILFDDTGAVVRSDDDGAGNLNARLGTFLAAGNYCAQISTVREVPESSGGLPSGYDAPIPFLISAGQTASAGQCARALGGIALVDAIEPGSAAQQASGQVPGRNYVRFSLAQPTAISVFARSTAFDTYLTLEDDFGAQIGGDDDGGGGTDSYLGFSSPLPAGDYCAEVTSYDGTQGAFTLAVSEWSEAHAASADGGLILDPCGEGASIVDLGDPLSSGFAPQMLAATVNNGPQFYRLDLSEPLDLRLTATSDVLDTVLGLYDADGNEIDGSDDADGLGTNSRITRNALPAGEYCVAVSPFSNEGSGQISFNLVEMTEAALLQEAYASGEILPPNTDGIYTDLGLLHRNLRHDDVSGGGTKWYLFEVDEESLVVVDASGLGSLKSLVLFDYEGSGLKLAESLSQPDDLSTRLVRTLNSGRYAIGVVRDDSGGMGASLLSLQRYVRPPRE